MWGWGWDGKNDGVINMDMEVVIMMLAAPHQEGPWIRVPRKGAFLFLYFMLLCVQINRYRELGIYLFGRVFT